MSNQSTTTIYLIEPRQDERRNALIALIESLSTLYPNQVETRDALAVTTGVPQVLDLLGSLVSPTTPAPDQPAPEYSRAPKRGKGGRRTRKTETPQPPPSAPGAPPSTLGPPNGDPPPAVIDELLAGGPEEKNPQFFNWKLLTNGKECNSLSTMMRYRKLNPGDRAMHKTLGMYEVAERGDGSLYLRRLSS